MKYEEFRGNFFANYWSLQKQKIIGNKIEFGRYIENSTMSRTDYFCRMLNKAGDLDPPIPESLLLFTEMGKLSGGIEEYP